jgi:hypothetical protein
MLGLQVTYLYDRAAMAARSRARYLAPIALIATIAGTYAVVHTTLNPTKDKQATSQSVTSTTGTTSKARKRFERSKFYSVHPGDNLTRIATKTGVAITTLEALNPNIDPNALQTGQRVRLRR